jgi:uncharacterized RDD family membrane protein YckC
LTELAFCTTCGTQNQDNAQFCTGCGSALQAQLATLPGQLSPVSGVPPPTVSYATAGPPLPPGATYAEWADRVVGFLIDMVLVGAGMGILYFLTIGLFATMAGLGSSLAGGMCCMMILLFPLSSLLVGLFNGVYLVAQRGASIGQGVMNLKVVDINGNLLTTGTAFIRLLARVALGFLPMVGPLLDLLWPLWDEKKQTLHDKAVGSYVLKLR